ncbi:putative pregnancy-specific beta-1-glycoprotein 7 [Dissostichus eleginoides]|uniref:Pregnancy-specific beta-1-glycoprotein 7 n=1 Tax=Dissostichus eleginoides TaxID=100907 RepID=A0AAD9BSM7_DISEL|nr:putative pregnancy-specific beta-1-glycoprotein 7 [Dissostichus eleginoides]
MTSIFLSDCFPPTAADVKYYFPIVRVGDEVTLPFDNVIDDQVKCESTVWYFTDSSSSVTLFEDGQIHKEAKAKSDRLRVTENCSLVIKKVTEEDVGLYTCRQFNNSGAQQGPDSRVDLSVLLLPTFSPQSSGEDAGKVTTVSTTWTTVRIRPAGETNNTASEDNQTEPEDNNKGLLRLIMVSVGLAALIITVVTVNIWTRAEGSKAQTEENMEQKDEDEVNYENDGGPSASV